MLQCFRVNGANPRFVLAFIFAPLGFVPLTALAPGTSFAACETYVQGSFRNIGAETAVGRPSEQPPGTLISSLQCNSGNNLKPWRFWSGLT